MQLLGPNFSTARQVLLLEISTTNHLKNHAWKTIVPHVRAITNQSFEIGTLVTCQPATESVSPKTGSGTFYGFLKSETPQFRNFGTSKMFDVS